MLDILHGKFSYVRCTHRRDRFPFAWLAWIFKEEEQRILLLQVVSYISALPPGTRITPSRLHSDAAARSRKPDLIAVIERLLSLGLLAVSKTNAPIFHYSPEDFDEYDDKYAWNNKLALSADSTLSSIVPRLQKIRDLWLQQDEVRSQRVSNQALMTPPNGSLGNQLAYYAFDGRQFLIKKADMDARAYWLAVANGWVENEVVEGVSWSPVAREFDTWARD